MTTTTISPRVSERYLLCDRTGARDELPLGEAVGGRDLQRSGLLDQEDAAVAELLHASLDLETDLVAEEKHGTAQIH